MSRNLCIAASAAGLALAASAGAATIRLDFISSGLAQNVRIQDTNQNVNSFVAAGQLKFKVLSGGTWNRFPVGRDLVLFCTDITQGANDGTLNIVPLAQAPVPGQSMGVARARMIEILYAERYAQANTNALDAAAFQLAIWEIVNEANLNLAAGSRASANLELFSGDFRATDNTNARNRANTFLDSAFTSFRGGGSGWSLASGVSSTVQDQIFIIPLPSAAGMGFVGVAALAAGRRRR